MNIEVIHATKYIKKSLILKDVNIHLESGTVYGLQGPNGGGKTMLMRLLCGLIRATEGQVLIDGKELGKDMDFPNSLGLLIENPAFLPGYTGLQNLLLLAQLQDRIGEKEAKQALLDVGLNPDDKRKYRKYSLGMKQRLGIAAAMMEQPELILLDEPFSALDAITRTEMRSWYCDMARELGLASVVITHDVDEAQAMSSRVYVLRGSPSTAVEVEPFASSILEALG